MFNFLHPVAFVPSKSALHPIDWQAISDSVDFTEFALDTAELQKIDISKLTGQKDALSFWINILNLMVLHIHVMNGPPTKSSKKIMFQAYKYEIGLQKFSLEDLIEGVLRGNPKSHFKKKDPRADFSMQQYDPRFHFGITYLNASSPPMRIMRPETISQQLNLAAEEFLHDEVAVLDKKKVWGIAFVLSLLFENSTFSHQFAPRFACLISLKSITRTLASTLLTSSSGLAGISAP